MANEAVIIELLGDKGDVVRYTCLDGVGIEKGTLLALDDPRTISGAGIGNENRMFAGIACSEKVASDGRTSLGVYTNGIFDLVASEAFNVGTIVCMSGANKVKAMLTLSGANLGKIVGKALETASQDEVIAVKVGVLI